MQRSTIIGLDLGGTKCAASILPPKGPLREIMRCTTRGPNETLEEIAKAIGEYVPKRSPVFGIACGGPLDASRGLVLAPPNMPGWDRVPVTRFFERRFGGRAFLMNDANANAIAEWRFGAGRRCCTMVYLTAGTGMGAGIIIDGKLHEGVCGNAGEVGHVRLAERGPVGFHKAGSFEGFCSGGGIPQMLEFISRKDQPAHRAMWRRQHPTTESIARAARKGDRTARAIFAESGRRLGQALAMIVDMLNPDRIVLGSLWIRCRDLLEPTMRQTLAAEALPPSLEVCRIVPAKLGLSTGNYGAVCAALHHLGC